MDILAFSNENGEDQLKLACVLPITRMMAYSFPSIACQGGGNPDGRFNKAKIAPKARIMLLGKPMIEPYKMV